MVTIFSATRVFFRYPFHLFEFPVDFFLFILSWITDHLLLCTCSIFLGLNLFCSHPIKGFNLLIGCILFTFDLPSL